MAELQFIDVDGVEITAYAKEIETSALLKAFTLTYSTKEHGFYVCGYVRLPHDHPLYRLILRGRYPSQDKGTFLEITHTDSFEKGSIGDKLITNLGNDWCVGFNTDVYDVKTTSIKSVVEDCEKLCDKLAVELEVLAAKQLNKLH